MLRGFSDVSVFGGNFGPIFWWGYFRMNEERAGPVIWNVLYYLYRPYLAREYGFPFGLHLEYR